MPTRRWTQTFRASTSVTAAEVNDVFLSIHTHLLALGFTQTADTGQVATISAALPVANVTQNSMAGASTNALGTTGYHGFRTYAFPADALTATSPLVLRVDYALSHGKIPGVVLTIGQSTNGAGFFPAGNTNTAFLLNATNSATAYSDATYIRNTAECVLSYTDGVLFFALGIGALPLSSSYAGMRPTVSPDKDLSIGAVMLGRPTDAAGAMLPNKAYIFNPITNVQVHVSFGWIPTAGGRISCTDFSTDVTLWTDSFSGLMWPDAGTMRSGQVQMGRLYAYYNDVGIVPIRNAAATPTGGVTRGDTTTLALVGVTARNYYCFGGGLNVPFINALYILTPSRHPVWMVEYDGVFI